ncbi:MAG: hypothetical protein ACFB0E_22165 [Leptolyngbyaceae cyanobacterium]
MGADAVYGIELSGLTVDIVKFQYPKQAHSFESNLLGASNCEAPFLVAKNRRKEAACRISDKAAMLDRLNFTIF